MKKFFFIATSLFIIGICLPILAANSGNRCEKKKYGVENAAWRPDPHGRSDCRKKKEAREAAAAAASAPLKNQNKQQAGIGNVKPKSDKEKKGTPNTSFNFLYYLFYKPSINEFLKEADYCAPSPSAY